MLGLLILSAVLALGHVHVLIAQWMQTSGAGSNNVTQFAVSSSNLFAGTYGGGSFFPPTITIPYAVPQRSQVTLTVFNTLGQPVSTLVSGTEEAGYHEVKFNGTNLASGVYFYRIQAGGFVQTRKLLLLR